MSCRRCGGECQPEGSDLSQGIVRCSQCQAISVSQPPTPVVASSPLGVGLFSFSPSQLDGTGLPRAEPPPASVLSQVSVLPGPLARPSGISEESSEGVYEFHWRWFDWNYLGLAILCGIWISAGCGAFGSKSWWLIHAWEAQGTELDRWLHYLPVVFVASLLYYVVAGLVNSSTLRIAEGQVSVEHGPLPWWGEFTFEATEVRQFFCTHQVHHHKRGFTVTYSLEMIDRSGRQVSVLGGFSDPKQPLYLEQQLEARLQIANEPIGGELRRMGALGL